MTPFEESTTYQVAAMLDLMFKLLWCKDKEERTARNTKLTEAAGKVSTAEQSEPEALENQEPKLPAKKAHNICFYG